MIQMDAYIDGLSEGWKDGSIDDRWIWMDEWVDRWMNGWVDRWMNGWVDG